MLKHEWASKGYTLESEFRAAGKIVLLDDLLLGRVQEHCVRCNRPRYLGRWLKDRVTVEVRVNIEPCTEDR